MIVTGRRRPDCLIDDPAQRLQDIGHVGGVALLLQFPVDGFDAVVAFTSRFV